MSSQTIKPPLTFYVISGIGILWNLMGLGAFISDMTVTADDLASMDEGLRSLYESKPAWLNIIYGIATISGVVGTVLLILRRKIAIQVLLVSFIAVVLQMVYSILASDAIEVLDTNQALIFPGMIIAISLFLWYYAKKSYARIWIT